MILNVDVEEQSTGEFSVAGGYSTSDGFVAEVSVGERNLLGRGQYGARRRSPTASVRAASSSRSPNRISSTIASPSASTCSPSRPTRRSSYVYRQETDRRRLPLRHPAARRFAVQLRYSVYQQRSISIRSCATVTTSTPISARSSTPRLSDHRAYGPRRDHAARRAIPAYQLLSDGEASAAVEADRRRRTRDRLAGRLQRSIYNTLDNNRNPTAACYAELRQDFAGVGGDVELHPHHRRRALTTTNSSPDIVVGAASAGRLHPRLGRQGPAHARPLHHGPEPGARLRDRRHRSARHDARHHARRPRRHDVLGRDRSKSRSPIFGVPKDFGLTACGLRRCRLALGLYAARRVHPGDGARRSPRSIRSPARIRIRSDACGLGRRRHDLGFAVRSAPLRLRVPAHQGSVTTASQAAPLQRRHQVLDRASPRHGLNGGDDRAAFLRAPERADTLQRDRRAARGAVARGGSPAARRISGIAPLDRAGAAAISRSSTTRNTPRSSPRPAPASASPPSSSPRALPAGTSRAGDARALPRLRRGRAELLSRRAAPVLAVRRDAASRPAPWCIRRRGSKPASTVDPGAVIGPGAEIGAGTVIAPDAVIGPEVRIGRDCSIGASATRRACADRRPGRSSMPACASARTASAICHGAGRPRQGAAGRPRHHPGRCRDRRQHARSTAAPTATR